MPTVKDILSELEKPGRDPRPEFKTATFMEGVEKIGDLKPGMMLEGVVTNVAAFGAFVDIGVHQDGLVHISALADTFVKDPRNVVKPGDIVKVKVLEVDMPRKRISLTMRMSDPAEKRPAGARRTTTGRPSRSTAPRPRGSRPPRPPPAARSPMPCAGPAWTRAAGSSRDRGACGRPRSDLEAKRLTGSLKRG